MTAIAAAAGWGLWQGWLPGITPLAGPAAPGDSNKQPDSAAGPLAPYELPRLATHIAGLDAGTVYYKPGHWMPLAVEVQANRNDLRGTVEAGFTADGLPAPIPPLGDRVATHRTLVTAKGQTRVAEILAYAPLSETPHRLEARLLDRNGNPLASAGLPARPLAAHQYFFLVLAREPEQYRYLAKQPALSGVFDELLPQDEQAAYVPLFPRPSARAAVPSAIAGWTSTACVVWDEYPADTWDEFQRQALVDWLHWGGRLIVSGPNSLDALRGTFLAPWLPATAGPTEQLADESLEALRAWDGRQALELPTRPDVVRLELNAADVDQRGGAVLLGSVERPLVVERSVGRGRVVVTAFRLNEPALVAWSGYDQLLNGVLLGRDARRFILFKGSGGLGVTWSQGSPFDARRNTSVRFFARDASLSAPRRVAAEARYVQLPGAPLPEWIAFGSTVPDAPPSFTQQGGRRQPPSDSAPQEVPRGPGVAAWNDFGDAADAARAALRGAARIVVPGRGFVLAVLAAYVVVLVPVNGLVCRWLGRIEWAWVAAPVVALGFTALVVRLADLDIGFARTSTTLTVVEVQPGYRRAHATHYTAIYNSLAARYRVGSNDPGAGLLPMSMNAPRDPLLAWLRREPVVDAAASTAVTRLEDLYVPSNSALVVHGEQMLDLGGTFDWVRLGDNHYRLLNRTAHPLHGAAVVGRSQAAWIGTLAPQVPADVWLGERPRDSLWREWHAAAESARSGHDAPDRPGLAAAAKAPAASQGVDAEDATPAALEALFTLAYDDVPPGELRLVGYAREALAEQTLEPAPSESRRAAVFVVHLTPPARKPPARDLRPAPAIAPRQP